MNFIIIINILKADILKNIYYYKKALNNFNKNFIIINC